MAKTKNGIVYPDNYDKVADVPADLKELAESVDEVIENNKTEMKKSNETRDEKISKNVEDIGIIQKTIKSEKESIDKSLENINTKDEKQDEDIKANKESIEELHAENLEIKAENERLRNDIKSIAVVNEVSGENIHIEDSSNARCEIEIDGNHQQETREGYNQFKITSTQTQSAGVTITKIDESSVSYQGTTTGMFTHMLVEYDGKGLEITKQMYLKAFGNLTNAILSVKVIKNGKTESSYLRVSPDLILSAGDVLQQIYVQQQNTGILVSGTLQVLLTDYENKDKPYEQYGASPSFAYPSPVKSVGNIKNILDMSNAKNGASAGIICTTNADGSYKYKGTATSQYINVWFMGGYATDLPTLFTLEPGTYYINDVSLFEGTTGFANDSSKKIWTFIRAYNVTGVRAVGAVSGNTYDETKYPIIAKIDHEIPWVPYNYGYAKIDIFNKNFIDIDKLKSLNSRNAYEKYNNVECLKLAGVTQRYNLNCKQNTQYVFQVNIVGYTYTSKLIGQFLIAYTDGSTSYMQTDGTNAGKYSLISKAGKTVKALVWNGYSSGHFAYIDKNDIQLDEATTLTNIVQHEEQSYLVDVQQEMLKGDTFVRKDGKWYEKHCVKTEIMLTFPTTNIEVCGTFANFQINRNIAFAVVKNDLKITNVRNDILCDKLKAKDNSMWGGKEDGIQTYINSNKFMISIPFEDIEKNFGEELTINNYSQAFKKYINDNGPFKIYYLLEEPELVECTEAQNKVLDEIYNKAHTYKNITNISAESVEVNPTLNIKYLKDAETEHNKLQAQINEIKELLSSTEISALLVNNLEKDLRMEVE